MLSLEHTTLPGGGRRGGELQRRTAGTKGTGRLVSSQVMCSSRCGLPWICVAKCFAAELDPNHNMAEAAKRVPKGVVCLVSALAFHGLTDQLPSKVWMAIATKDWAQRRAGTPIRIVRFADSLRREGVETHVIEGVAVKVFGLAKTVADCFRQRGKVGLSVAIEGLQEALRQRKATPAEIVRQAEKGGVSTVIRPYLEALTANR